MVSKFNLANMHLINLTWFNIRQLISGLSQCDFRMQLLPRVRSVAMRHSLKAGLFLIVWTIPIRIAIISHVNIEVLSSGLRLCDFIYMLLPQSMGHVNRLCLIHTLTHLPSMSTRNIIINHYFWKCAFVKSFKLPACLSWWLPKRCV